MSRRLGYLGPAGTFTEEAALLYEPQGHLVTYPTISAVAQAVASRAVDQGVVPIENSIAGSVAETLDLLIRERRLFIYQEITLPIHHYLLVRPGIELGEVRQVLSHPMALAQCQRWLQRYLPGVPQVAMASTTTAVQQMMAGEVVAAAIAPRRAAKLFRAKIAARRIQDYPKNLTRFVVLGHSDHPRTGADRTSLCFSFAQDHPGLLVDVLQEFASRGINLAKIESRPIKEYPGRYCFLIDLDGHRTDTEPDIAQALANVQSRTTRFRVFGSYPRYLQRGEKEERNANSEDSDVDGEDPSAESGAGPGDYRSYSYHRPRHAGVHHSGF